MEKVHSYKFPVTLLFFSTEHATLHVIHKKGNVGLLTVGFGLDQLAKISTS